MGRFSPPGYGKIIQSQSLNLTFGGGEANVAGGLAHLGIPATHVTKFPANELGKQLLGIMLEWVLTPQKFNLAKVV